jgi:hypothetical protein
MSSLDLMIVHIDTIRDRLNMTSSVSSSTLQTLTLIRAAIALVLMKGRKQGAP